MAVAWVVSPWSSMLMTALSLTVTAPAILESVPVPMLTVLLPGARAEIKRLELISGGNVENVVSRAAQDRRATSETRGGRDVDVVERSCDVGCVDGGLADGISACAQVARSCRRSSGDRHLKH